VTVSTIASSLTPLIYTCNLNIFVLSRTHRVEARHNETRMTPVSSASTTRAPFVGRVARPRPRAHALRAAEKTPTSTSTPPPPLTDGVAFVLCRPEGPINVGSAARAMQNFGVRDLRVVNPGPAVVSDLEDDARRLSEEAYKFAVHAGWMLDGCKKHSVGEALSDRTLVVATTARARENLPLYSLTEGMEMIARELEEGGTVGVLFGNEATGLTNQELELATFGICIPTAAHAEERTKSGKVLKYTGGSGAGKGDVASLTPVSLNLGMAAGVIAWELFRATRERETTIRGFESHRMSVGERSKLIDDVVAARRAVEIFGNEEHASSESDAIRHEKERRAITSVFSAGPIASRDATPLFMLARRALAFARMADADSAVKRIAIDYISRVPPGETASAKSLNAQIRDELGISLTQRELERVMDAAASAIASVSV